ncbi:MAG: isoprenylcysteine carboxylmethyltransferase family protein [Myxococcota bacterium]
MTRRISIFLFGVIAYALFLAVFLYSTGFMTGLVVPKSIDSGPSGPVGRALLVDLSLLAVFAVQHSVMARPGFKRAWTRIVDPRAERSVYVLASCIAMGALFALWEPLPAIVFELASPVARTIAYGLFGLGIATILYATFLIDHFDLFGLRQSWLALRGIPYTHRPFATPGLYRHVRHPLYVGWFLFFWATPTMTVGHLLMAIATTGYILIAIVFEERDLLVHFGSDYRAWRARTPLFFPRLGRRGLASGGQAGPRSRAVGESA